MDTDTQSKVSWFEYVLQCAYNLDHAMTYLCDRLEPLHVTSKLVGAGYAHQLVYTEMREYWQQHDERPGKDVLLRMLQQTLRAVSRKGFNVDVSKLADEVFSVVWRMTGEFDKTQSIKKAVDLINVYYEHLVSRPSIKAAFEDAMSAERLDASTLNAEISSSVALIGGARKPSNVFDFEIISDPSVIGSGIGWLNKLLTGGFRRGLAYGIIIPTGGGKTTLAGQISFSVANMGVPAAVVYTEQSMQEPEMIARFWSLVTNKPYDLYLNQLRADKAPTTDDLNDVQRSTMEVVGNNLQAYDFSVQRGSIAELRSIAMGHMGKAKPQILIVDWAEQFAKGLLTTDPKLQKSGANITHALQYVADECALIAREAQIPVAIFQMMAPSAGTTAMKRYTHADAQNCKSFCNNLAYGIVVPPRDENHITRAEVTKGRYSLVDKQIIKLVGECGRFDALKNYRMGRYKYEPENRRQDEMPDAANRSKPSGGFTMDFES